MCERKRETEEHKEIKRERRGRALCACSTQVHLNVRDIFVIPVSPACFSDGNILGRMHSFNRTYLLQYK